MSGGIITITPTAGVMRRSLGPMTTKSNGFGQRLISPYLCLRPSPGPPSCERLSFHPSISPQPHSAVPAMGSVIGCDARLGFRGSVCLKVENGAGRFHFCLERIICGLVENELDM